MLVSHDICRALITSWANLRASIVQDATTACASSIENALVAAISMALVERRGNCGWDNTNTTSDKCIGVEAEVPDKVVYLVPDPMLP